MCSEGCEATKLIFNISKCICFFLLLFNLVYFFFLSYMCNILQNRLTKIKYQKIICASNKQLTSLSKGRNHRKRSHENVIKDSPYSEKSDQLN